MTNAFEYGDALLPQPEAEKSDGETTPTPTISSNQPYLNLATYVLPSPINLFSDLFGQIPHGGSC